MGFYVLESNLYLSLSFPPSPNPFELIFCSVIGMVTDLISHINAEKVRFERYIHKIKHFFHSKKLPFPLQDKVLEYLLHVRLLPPSPLLMASPYPGLDV